MDAAFKFNVEKKQEFDTRVAYKKLQENTARAGFGERFTTAGNHHPAMKQRRQQQPGPKSMFHLLAKFKQADRFHWKKDCVKPGLSEL